MLFILNNLAGETAEMMKKYKIGLNFNENNLSEILCDVCLNWETYRKYKSNADLLINNELDSVKIYNRLALNILNSIE